jgi:hypothetical protein
MNETTSYWNAGKLQRKLEDLFADEPFLSPTMKARSLHEKLRVHPPATSGLARSAQGAEPPFDALCLVETRVSLEDAVRLLRTERERDGVLIAEEECLHRFREQVLPEWLKLAPARENG